MLEKTPGLSAQMTAAEVPVLTPGVTSQPRGVCPPLQQAGTGYPPARNLGQCDNHTVSHGSGYCQDKHPAAFGLGMVSRGCFTVVLLSPWPGLQIAPGCISGLLQGLTEVPLQQHPALQWFCEPRASHQGSVCCSSPNHRHQPKARGDSVSPVTPGNAQAAGHPPLKSFSLGYRCDSPECITRPHLPQPAPLEGWDAHPYLPQHAGGLALYGSFCSSSKREGSQQRYFWKEGAS